MAFDCLRVHGVDVRGLPLHRRRRMLEEELAGARGMFPVGADAGAVRVEALLAPGGTDLGLDPHRSWFLA